MNDYIDPVIGLPLAAILSVAWWLVERRAARTTNHEIRRQP